MCLVLAAGESAWGISSPTLLTETGCWESRAETREQSYPGSRLDFCTFSSWKLVFAELRVLERWETTEIRVAAIEIHMFGV